MAEYLDKFRGTIGKRQADQILKLLNKKKNAGQIRTVDEFTQRLDDLIRELTGTVLQPTLKVYETGENRVISSEIHNTMLDRVQDDLSAAFEEALNIDEVQKAHEAIVRDVSLKNLRAGVAELESKIDLYEFLNKDTNGFDTAIFSTFRESKKERTQRGSGANTLFLDPRTKEVFDTSLDASVELVGERLTLATNSRTTHNVSSVRQIFDSTSPQSELLLEQKTSSIRNIIDGENGTYWIQTIGFPERQTSIKVQLEFDLGAIKEVNFIEVEPVIQEGLYLEEVQYLTSDGIFTSLVSPDLLFDGPIGLQIKKIATRKIILVFRNENSKASIFQHNVQDTLYNQTVNAPANSINLNSVSFAGISDNLVQSMPSVSAQELVGVESQTPVVYNGFTFTTGFDNVRFGIAQYDESGVYVSAPMEMCGKGHVALRTVETRPMIDDSESGKPTVISSTTYDGDDDDIYLGSIEYWVVKQDFNQDGILFKTSRFPILPLGVSRVHHERLLLTEKSDTAEPQNDIGTVMFYTVCDDGGGGDGDVVVYRNGIQILNVDLNASATEGWRQADPITTDADKTPDNSQAMRFRIQIVGALSGDIYTVSYTPMVSSTPSIPDPPYGTFTAIGGLQVVDMVGDLSIRRNTGQVVVVESAEESQTLASSKLYLLIILRRNAARLNISPAVEEYILMGSCQDLTKFEE